MKAKKYVAYVLLAAFVLFAGLAWHQQTGKNQAEAPIVEVYARAPYYNEVNPYHAYPTAAECNAAIKMCEYNREQDPLGAKSYSAYILRIKMGSKGIYPDVKQPIKGGIYAQHVIQMAFEWNQFHPKVVAESD